MLWSWWAVLLILLCSIAWQDWKFRRIPNVDVLLMWVLGAIAASANASPLAPSVSQAVLGGCIAFLGLLPFYALGWMGAGDVKLAGALGVWLGPSLLLAVWIVSVAMAIAYGACAQSLYRDRWLRGTSAKDAASLCGRRVVPYGAMLCAAAVLVLGWSLG